MEGVMLIRLRLMVESLFVTQRGLIFDWQIDWCLTGRLKEVIGLNGLMAEEWIGLSIELD
jgi:hypothetical protein